jgi:hypothetical protein
MTSLSLITVDNNDTNSNVPTLIQINAGNAAQRRRETHLGISPNAICGLRRRSAQLAVSHMLIFREVMIC